jgi:hypothetical protein
LREGGNVAIHHTAFTSLLQKRLCSYA